MSQENVELVRRGFDAFARRDIDAILAGLDPDIDVRPAPELPGADSYPRPCRLCRLHGAISRVVGGVPAYPREIHRRGRPGRLLYQAVGRGRGSGIDLETRFGHVWTVREGRAVRWEVFRTHGEALEAVGLPE